MGIPRTARRAKLIRDVAAGGDLEISHLAQSKDGCVRLVLSVDVPGRVQRERNLRNGFTRPLKPTLSAKMEALLHPGWLMEYMNSEGMTASNWAKYAPKGATAEEVVSFMASQFPTPATWDDVAWIRKQWPRKFVIKGVMSPDDVARCAAMGVDGVMLSNHGGRQLDRAPSPLEVLPVIRDRLGEKIVSFRGTLRASVIDTALPDHRRCPLLLGVCGRFRRSASGIVQD